MDYSDEMGDGAKLAMAVGLMAAGGLAAWWIGKPAEKTAGGIGASGRAGLSGSALRAAVSDPDFPAGFTAGQHVAQFTNGAISGLLNQGNLLEAAELRLSAMQPPAGHSKAWNHGFYAGFLTTIMSRPPQFTGASAHLLQIPSSLHVPIGMDHATWTAGFHQGFADTIAVAPKLPKNFTVDWIAETNQMDSKYHSKGSSFEFGWEAAAGYVFHYYGVKVYCPPEYCGGH